MSAPDDRNTPGWREFTASLRFLEAEGFIVRWTDAQGNEWVRKELRTPPYEHRPSR